MSRFVRILPAILAAALVCASCGNKAAIDGILAQAPSSEVIVKVLDVNIMETIDTVRTGADGKFSFKLDIEKGQPEFVYLFHSDKKIASLLLERGDRVSVEADTLGNWTVSGSEESAKLAQVEKSYNEALRRMQALSDALQAAEPNSSEAQEIKRRMGQEYVSYYRDRVRYVMENSHSLTIIPVFYQRLGDNLPVFGQSTDAIHFSNACDSLMTVYPESKYVKALLGEAKSRNNFMDFEMRLRNATEIGFPDINLPDINARKVALSSLESKVVMVQFWSAAEASQKMFNQDVLKPVYEEFHGRGFEIYQVSLDTDKTMWARVVKEQNMPWISVSDARGSASPYVTLYNIPALPATYIISNGALVDGKVVDAKSLRKLLEGLLK